MLDGQVAGSDGDRIIQRNDLPLKRLGDETFGNVPSAILGQVFIDLTQDNSR
jgi:hypothetical protein